MKAGSAMFFSGMLPNQTPPALDRRPIQHRSNQKSLFPAAIFIIVFSFASSLILAADTGPWIVPGPNPETDLVISWIAIDDAAEQLFYFGTKPASLEPVSPEIDGDLRRVRLFQLLPGVEYVYSTTGRDGKMNRFTSFDASPGLRFAVFGDMQSMNPVSEAGNEIMEQALAKAGTDLYVQLGDLVEIGSSEKNWRSALHYLGHFAASAPIAPLPGNHDHYLDPNLKNFRSFFPVDYVVRTGGYYSFDLKGVHFLLLDNFDTPLGLGMSSAQKKWAEEDLKSADDRGITWKFVFLHHSILSTATSAHNWDVQSWLIPLADKHGVDAVFFGHDHNYEHWIYEYGWNDLVYGPADTPSGREIHYFCSGGGGARSEIHYGLLSHSPLITRRRWYDLDAGTWENVTTERMAWNKELFIDHTDNPYFGQPFDGKHYYHLPSVQSYSTDNEHYGHQYGEQTLHYIIVDIPEDQPDVCRISVHYPNGEILTGPDGRLPQQWELRK